MVFSLYQQVKIGLLIKVLKEKDKMYRKKMVFEFYSKFRC